MLLRRSPRPPPDPPTTIYLAPVDGRRVVGAFDLADCALAHDPLAAEWQLTVAAPSTVAVEVTSADVSGDKLVTDLAMRRLTIHDGDLGAQTPSARRVHSLLPSNYVVWATSNSTIEVGSYAITVHSVTPCAFGSAAAGYTLGQTRVGTLLTSDCVLRDGRPADGQVITVGTKTVVRVDRPVVRRAGAGSPRPTALHPRAGHVRALGGSVVRRTGDRRVLTQDAGDAHLRARQHDEDHRGRGDCRRLPYSRRSTPPASPAPPSAISTSPSGVSRPGASRPRLARRHAAYFQHPD